jgi:glycosyltransferase involved in cell wall biosynthesis
MKVGVDARHLAAGRGVAHYTRGALGALAAAHPDDEWRCFVPGRRPVDAPAADNVVLVRDRRPGRVVFGAAALLRRPRLDRLLGGGLDVVWIPAPAPVALSASVPYVLTVHDLSWEERPGDFTGYERRWHRLARPTALARGAARVSAVSRTTADLAIASWGLDPERVSVASPGIEPAIDPPGPPLDGVPERYLLFVGALEPRKGPDLLAVAYARARTAGLDIPLVVVGEGRLRSAFDGLPDTTVRPAASRAELASLYACATAVIAPSWLEGFGFVPLEAATYGTPSVLSDLPIFAETLQDHALFVPVGDAEALSAMLVTAVLDPARGRATGALARERAATYTWEACAEGLHAALAAAAGIEAAPA